MDDDELDSSTEALLKLLDSASKSLSPKQLSILTNMNFNPGLQAIVAGAGAGKTRLLAFIAILASLKATGGVSILAATRTAKMEAYERANGLYKQLDFEVPSVVRPLSLARVKTIHAVAHARAKEQNDESGGSGVVVVAKATITELLYRSILDETEEVESDPRASTDSKDDVVINVPPHDAAALLYNVRAERLKNGLPVVDDALGPTARRVLERLQREMECNENGMELIDFDLMISRLASSGEPLGGPGDVLLVDEAQDLSRSQVQIIMNTLENDSCVVVLGDDSQGIFHFSGAMDNTIHDMKKLAVGHGIEVAENRLMQNHRSTESIVQCSERMLPALDRSLRTGIEGNGEASKPVEVVLSQCPGTVANKICDLIQQDGFTPGQIVVLRHKGFSHADPVVKALGRTAAERKIHLPIVLPGQDALSSIQMKTVAILQLALGLEFFVESPDDGSRAMRAFLRSLRHTRGAPPLAVAAIEAVWTRRRCDPSVLFTRHESALLGEFQKLESEEPKSENAKRQRTDGTSIKFSNFEETVRVASAAIKQVKERLRQAAAANLPLRPIVVSSDKQSKLSGPDFGISKERRPVFEHPGGALVFIIMRDLVDHTFTDGDAIDVEEVVRAFDVPATDDESLEDVMVRQVTKLSSKMLDKETNGKLIFSTIHSYKGREREAAFVIDIKKPFCNPDAAKKASLSAKHDGGCTNLAGSQMCSCHGFVHGLNRMREAGMNEKLRLYYVAASRAKRRLFLQFAEVFDKLDLVCPKAGRNEGSWTLIDNDSPAR